MNDDEYLASFNRDYWATLKAGGPAALSTVQRASLCVTAFQAELNNGGMHQYLLNSSGDFAAETPALLRTIGATKAAELLEIANSFFGPSGPPTDRDKRVKQLLALPKEAEDRIHRLSDEFFDAEDEGMCLADLFDSYVLSHRNK